MIFHLEMDFFQQLTDDTADVVPHLTHSHFTQARQLPGYLGAMATVWRPRFCLLMTSVAMVTYSNGGCRAVRCDLFWFSIKRYVRAAWRAIRWQRISMYALHKLIWGTLVLLIQYYDSNLFPTTVFFQVYEVNCSKCCSAVSSVNPPIRAVLLHERALLWPTSTDVLFTV